MNNYRKSYLSVIKSVGLALKKHYLIFICASFISIALNILFWSLKNSYIKTTLYYLDTLILHPFFIVFPICYIAANISAKKITLRDISATLRLNFINVLLWTLFVQLINYLLSFFITFIPPYQSLIFHIIHFIINCAIFILTPRFYMQILFEGNPFLRSVANTFNVFSVEQLKNILLIITLSFSGVLVSVVIINVLGFLLPSEFYSYTNKIVSLMLQLPMIFMIAKIYTIKKEEA